MAYSVKKKNYFSEYDNANKSSTKILIFMGIQLYIFLHMG